MLQSNSEVNYLVNQAGLGNQAIILTQSLQIDHQSQISCYHLQESSSQYRFLNVPENYQTLHLFFKEGVPVFALVQKHAHCFLVFLKKGCLMLLQSSNFNLPNLKQISFHLRLIHFSFIGTRNLVFKNHHCALCCCGTFKPLILLLF